MKTIVEINSTNYASTGNIMLNIASEARKNGYKVYTSCKASKESFKHYHENEIIIGFRIERILSSLLATYTGLRDHFNWFGTLSFIRKLKQVKPDLVHLHVLHDDFINTGMLFHYLSKSGIPVIWTFHDCCAMTGKCPYFDIANCDKWKSGCHKCPQLHIEAESKFFDTTMKIWKERKDSFTSLKDLTVVSPSQWLADLIKQSFFKDYPVKVINNGIDLNKFRPMISDIKTKYQIEDKYLILGVANFWGERKGLDVFIRLAKMLPDEYQIMLVGTNDEIDKLLPNNIISIHRTYNQEELVKIYSSADLFVNPTREENFPTVNVEALACGIPVLTYNTGGSPEIISKDCGSVVDKDDIDELKKSIIDICVNNKFKKKNCLKRAGKYDMKNLFKEYIKLYEEILKTKS
ncbi:MAG: glycosyltransferase [Erysipelotrichaceae bacterium]|nr:glycosyltransferase [Erysipelotrichaceae bacterium]